MEVSQHSKFFCEFCGKYAVKRKAVGIWGCKDCGKMKAWGAYTLKFLLIGEEGSVLFVDKFHFLNFKPENVLQGHSPFRQLANRFEDKLVVAAGKGDPASVIV
ncbi:hypothetical protein P8452_57236 [Trifolium repens]|nr:hypothetical protein P8452_57236 [Trifolium repens]